MNKKVDMKRGLKLLLVMLFISFIGIGCVDAASVPSSLSVTHHILNNTPLSFPYTFHVKQTTDGKYVYCMTYSKAVPVTGIGYSKSSLYTDAGTNYILEQGYKASNDQEYFIAQTALWIYLMDKGDMSYSSTVNTFKSTVSSSSSATATKIKNMVAKAKSLSSYDVSAPTISLSGNVNFTLSEDGKTYVGECITVNSSEANYKVELVGAPTGTTYKVNGGKLTLEIPASSISSDTQAFEIKVSNSKKVYSAYKYVPSNSSYQVMGVTYEDVKTASDSLSTKLALNKVVISKQDVTNKEELPGASLVVKDKDGNVIDSWVSTNKPHELELRPGTYTLSETIAPDGYDLSTEVITFEVTDDGIATNVVMYNKKTVQPIQPEQPSQEVAVPSTGSYKTIASSMIGALIIIVGSVLITKNIKKKNEE